MKKIIISLMLALIVISGSALLLACSQPQPPIKLQMNEIDFDTKTGVLSFDVVENAQDYEFTVDGVQVSLLLNGALGKMEYQFDAYNIYTVTVKALGNNKEWLNSDSVTKSCEYPDPIIFDEIEAIIETLAGECWKIGNPVIQNLYLKSKVFGINILTNEAYVGIITKTSGTDATPIKYIYILKLGTLPATINGIKAYLSNKVPTAGGLAPFGQGAPLETDANAERLISAFLNRAALLDFQSYSDRQTINKLNGLSIDNIVVMFATQFTATNTNLLFILDNGTVVSVLLGATGLPADAITSAKKIDAFESGAFAIIRQITIQDYKWLI